MAALTHWAWDDTNKEWVKVLADDTGRLIIVAEIDHLNDIGDVNVPAPGDNEVLIWDAVAGEWVAEAIPAAAWADITGKPTAPSLEEMATEHEADGTHGDITPTTCSIQYALPANQKEAAIVFIIDGGGAAITTGEKGHLEIPFACTISQATLLADQSGSIVIDIWKDTYANFPPTVADTITAAAKPTITTAQKSQDSTLTGWTTAIAAGDILAFNVDSITTIQRVTLVLKVTKT